MSIALVETVAVAERTWPFIGEAAALLAAFFWAAATLMFGRLGRELSPIMLNLIKGMFAITFLAVTLGIQTRLSGNLPQMPQGAWLPLLLSGAVGIGIGDTAYFSAINSLGARRALLLETLAPPMAAVLAWLFLAEQLSVRSLLGIVITLVGVAWVISERVPGTPKQVTAAGVRVAILATFCQASGAVLSRAALADTEVSPLWSSLLRLFAGLVLMGAVAYLRPRLLENPLIESPLSESPSTESPSKESSQKSSQHRWYAELSYLKSPRLLGAVALTSFFATYLGIWLQQISLKYTATGIAQALLATSPLFVLPMAAILGEGLSRRAVLGVIVALSGVWLLLSVA
ncbi:MAG: DMT family transporter [Cyanobacteria bacterium J06649_4]